MSAKLLDERPLLVLPSLAKEIGLNEAIVAQQLHWVLQRDSLEEIDGRRWIKADLQFWAKQFPWWSEKTIGRIFEALESANMVITRRTKNAKLYTVNPEHPLWTGQSGRSETDNLSPATDNLSDTRVRENGERTTERETALAASDDATGQLFAAPGEVKEEAVSPDPAIDAVWAAYAQHFGDRLRVKELTAPRRRTILKALKATGWTESPDTAGASGRVTAIELCQRAIVGLKSYRADHPDGSQDVNISVIFETGPHSKSNLTDQITWWADQGKSSVPGRDGAIRIPLDLAGVPSVTKGTIQNRRREVGQMFDHPDSPSAKERGELAVTWLREHIGHEPKVEDGEFRGWQLVVDFTPPSRESA